MARSKEASASSKSLVLIAVVLAIATLYVGRQLFIPIALATVFAFLLTPFVSILEKLRIGRVPAVVTVLLFTFMLAGLVTWGVATQLVQVMVNLSDYKSNLDTKIRSLRTHSNGSLSRASATVQELSKELASVPGQVSSGYASEKDSRTARPVRPIPVQVAAPPSNFVQDLRELLGPLAEPAEIAAIVIIFTLFMLIKREDLRNRAIRLAGKGQLNVMTQALDDAGKRLSRYLLMQFLVNAGYGLLFGVALYFIGVPHVLLWGVFAAILRFVPYVGSPIAAALPIAMALAVFPAWREAEYIFGVFLVLELTVANVVEPLLYGAHTGISSLAILVAAVFWASLWGPVGLVLSTPLTVCLIVLGRHVPQLDFLEVLLGDEPVLLPEQCFYQRLLALDEIEARAIAESYLKENTLEDLYDSVILPALRLADQDHHTDGLDDATRDFMFQAVRELIEDLGEGFQQQEPQDSRVEADSNRQKSSPKFAPLTASVACIPATGGFDELVATMLAQLLALAGARARDFKAGTADEVVHNVSTQHVDVTCVSSISSVAVGQARYLCKRLRTSAPSLQIVLGLWSFELSTARQRLGPGCPGDIVTSLSQAISQIRKLQSPIDAQDNALAENSSQTTPA